MRASSIFAALVTLAATTLPTTLSASVITLNQTLDLNQPQSLTGPGFQGWQDTPAFDGGYNVAIAEGDTFDFTIDFLGTQSLTVTNLSQVWAFSFSESPDSNVTGTGTFSFLDAAGLPFLASILKNDTEGAIHFGQFFFSGDFTGGLPSSITFSGVRYVGTLDDYVEAGLTTRNYNIPAFYFDADTATVASAVPEPASLAIFGIGAVGLAFFAAGRRDGGKRECAS